eukprot:6208564-Pleurochrysis_carterae.AAC.4
MHAAVCAPTALVWVVARPVSVQARPLRLLQVEEEGEHKAKEQGANVERRRAEDGELGINHLDCISTDHHAAWVEVTMAEGENVEFVKRVPEVLRLERLDLAHERFIGSELAARRVKCEARCEDMLELDPAKRRVPVFCGALSRVSVISRRSPCMHLAKVLAQAVSGLVRNAATREEVLKQQRITVEELHNEHRVLRIEVVNLRQQSRAKLCVEIRPRVAVVRHLARHPASFEQHVWLPFEVRLCLLDKEAEAVAPGHAEGISAACVSGVSNQQSSRSTGLGKTRRNWRRNGGANQRKTAAAIGPRGWKASTYSSSKTPADELPSGCSFPSSARSTWPLSRVVSAPSVELRTPRLASCARYSRTLSAHSMCSISPLSSPVASSPGSAKLDFVLQSLLGKQLRNAAPEIKF